MTDIPRSVKKQWQKQRRNPPKNSLQAITSIPLTKKLKTPTTQKIGTLDMLTQTYSMWIQPLNSALFTGLQGNVLNKMVVLLYEIFDHNHTLTSHTFSENVLRISCQGLWDLIISENECSQYHSGRGDRSRGGIWLDSKHSIRTKFLSLKMSNIRIFWVS